MKDYRKLIKELPSNTIVCALGEFNPPTTGHELLVKTVKRLAEQKRSDHVIYTSSKNSLIQEDKKSQYLSLMFPKTKFKSLQESKFQLAVKELSEKYKNIVIVVGSDQVAEVRKLVTESNSIQIITINEKDPDVNYAKMKQFAVKGLYEEFKKKLPSTIRELDGRRLMNDLRIGLGMEPVKEQIVLVKDELREQYFRGEIFNEGDIVESSGEKYTIVKRGSNHLLLKEQSGALVSKWIQDVKPTEEKEMNEDLTNKTLKPTDKIKVARVIATMLGIDNAETSSSPENLVNQALRKIRTKSLNPETLNILHKMLQLATEQGIVYDTSLVPSKLKEGVIQQNGTDKIDPASTTAVTGEPVPKQKGVKKGFLTFYNYQDSDAIKEDAYTSEYQVKKFVGQDGKTHERKIRPHRIDFAASKADGEPAQKDSLQDKDKEVKKESRLLNFSEGLGRGRENDEGQGGSRIPRKDFMNDRPHTVHIDGKPWKKFPNGHQAKAAAKTLEAKGKKVSVIGHFKEEVEAIEESMTDSWTKVQSMDKGSVTGSKEDAKKRLAYLTALHAHHKKFGNDTKKVKSDIESLNRSRLAEEETKVCPVCEKEDCECDDSHGYAKSMEPTFDPFYKEEAPIDMSSYETDYADEVDEMSEQEIDSLVAELTDEDIVDAYDEHELAEVDEETGEEVEQSEDEKKIDEQLMEVLSRMERMRAKQRLRKTQSKRERSTKIALKRYSDTSTINKRARRLAVKLMKKRMLRGRDPSKLSIGEKERIERTLEKRKAVIGRVAQKLVSRVRKVEKDRMSHSKYTKGTMPSVF